MLIVIDRVSGLQPSLSLQISAYATVSNCKCNVRVFSFSFSWAIHPSGSQETVGGAIYFGLLGNRQVISRKFAIWL